MWWMAGGIERHACSGRADRRASWSTSVAQSGSSRCRRSGRHRPSHRRLSPTGVFLPSASRRRLPRGSLCRTRVSSPDRRGRRVLGLPRPRRPDAGGWPSLTLSTMVWIAVLSASVSTGLRNPPRAIGSCVALTVAFVGGDAETRHSLALEVQQQGFPAPPPLHARLRPRIS